MPSFSSSDATKQKHKDFASKLLLNQSRIKAYLMTLVFDRNIVSEIMQEVNVQLLDKEQEYDSTRDFFPWACSLAKFVVLGHLRDKQRERMSFDSELIAQIESTSKEIIQKQYDERSEKLNQCIQRLPEDRKKILFLHYGDGYTLNQISCILNRKPNTVSQILSRIRKVLAMCMEKNS